MEADVVANSVLAEPMMKAQPPSRFHSQAVGHIFPTIFRDLFSETKNNIPLPPDSKDDQDEYRTQVRAVLAKRDAQLAALSKLEADLTHVYANWRSEQDHDLSETISLQELSSQGVLLPSHLSDTPVATNEPPRKPPPHYLSNTTTAYLKQPKAGLQASQMGTRTHGALSMGPLETSTSKLPHGDPEWKNQPSLTEIEEMNKTLSNIERRNRGFLKNPRCTVPSRQDSYQSLGTRPHSSSLTQTSNSKGTTKQPIGSQSVSSTSKTIKMKADQARSPFLIQPAEALFSRYNIGETYECVIKIVNNSSVSSKIRLLPNSACKAFSCSSIRFPTIKKTEVGSSADNSVGGSAILAPGLSCEFTVIFRPDTLLDFSDFATILPETGPTLKVPFLGHRDPPLLSFSSSNLDCGPALVGTSVTKTFECRNEGGEGVFRFVAFDEAPLDPAMIAHFPSEFWLPSSLANRDNQNVETVHLSSNSFHEACFTVSPAIFSLKPHESCQISVSFTPSSASTFRLRTAVLMNTCHLFPVDLVGDGDVYACSIELEAERVSGAPDLYFSECNPGSFHEKMITISNSSLLPLPFRWSSLLKSLFDGGDEVDENEASVSSCTNPAVSTDVIRFSPDRGEIPALSQTSVLVRFSPIKLGTYVIVSSLSYGPPGDEASQHELQIEASCVPFQVQISPPFITCVESVLLGTSISRELTLYNQSSTQISFSLTSHSTDNVSIKCSPADGAILGGSLCRVEVSISSSLSSTYSGGPFFSLIECNIPHSDAVLIPVEGTLVGSEINMHAAALDFGSVLLGEKKKIQLPLSNASEVSTEWSISLVGDKLREFVSFSPSQGMIPAFGTEIVNVHFDASSDVTLNGCLARVSFSSDQSSKLIDFVGESVEPILFFERSTLSFEDTYVGIPSSLTLDLRNTTSFPSPFAVMPFSQRNEFFSMDISPHEGFVPPHSSTILSVHITPLKIGLIPRHVYGISCNNGRQVLHFGIEGSSKGRLVHFSHEVEDSGLFPSSNAEEEIDREIDFGVSSHLRHPVVRRFKVENCSGITTKVSLDLKSFPAFDQRQVNKTYSDTQRVILLQSVAPSDSPSSKKGSTSQQLKAKRTSHAGLLLPSSPPGHPLPNFTLSKKETLKHEIPFALNHSHTAKAYSQSLPPPPEVGMRETLQIFEMADASLRGRKGLAVKVLPSSQLKLDPFETKVVELVCFADMFGDYRDELICVAEDSAPVVFNIKASVLGCPISLQLSGPHNEPAAIRFPTIVAGASPKLIDASFDDPVSFEDHGKRPTSSRSALRPGTGSSRLNTAAPAAETVSRSLRVNNNSFCDLTLRWEVYDTIDSDNNLVDCVITATHDAEEESDSLISCRIRAHEGIPSAKFALSPLSLILPAKQSAQFLFTFGSPIAGDFSGFARCYVDSSLFPVRPPTIDDLEGLVSEKPGVVHMAPYYNLESTALAVNLGGIALAPRLVLQSSDFYEAFHVSSDRINPFSDSALQFGRSHCELKFYNPSPAIVTCKVKVESPFSILNVRDIQLLPKNSEVNFSEIDIRTLPSMQSTTLCVPPLGSISVPISFTVDVSLVKEATANFNLTPPTSENGGETSSLPPKNPGFLSTKRIDAAMALIYPNGESEKIPLRGSILCPLLSLVPAKPSLTFGTCLISNRQVLSFLVENKGGSSSIWRIIIKFVEPQPTMSASNFNTSASSSRKQKRGDQVDLNMLAFMCSPNEGLLAPFSSQEVQIAFSPSSSIKYHAQCKIIGSMGEETDWIDLLGVGTNDEGTETRPS